MDSGIIAIALSVGCLALAILYLVRGHGERLGIALRLAACKNSVEAFSYRLDGLERRIAGVEAMLVSTVGQETQSFCRAMDALMDKMDAQKEEQEPAPKPRPTPKEKFTLSKEYCGRYGKGKRRG